MNAFASLQGHSNYDEPPLPSEMLQTLIQWYFAARVARKKPHLSEVHLRFLATKMWHYRLEADACEWGDWSAVDEKLSELERWRDDEVSGTMLALWGGPQGTLSPSSQWSQSAILLHHTGVGQTT